MQQWRGDTKVSGELDEVLEWPRESLGQPLGPEDCIRLLRVLCPLEQAECGVPIEIVITRTNDTVRSAKPGGREQFCGEPPGKLRVSGRLALPGQVARDDDDLRLPVGLQFQERL